MLQAGVNSTSSAQSVEKKQLSFQLAQKCPDGADGPELAAAHQVNSKSAGWGWFPGRDFTSLDGQRELGHQLPPLGAWAQIC